MIAPRRPSTLIVGLTLAAVAVMALLDSEGLLDVGAGALVAVLLLGLGAAGFTRAAWSARRR